MEKNNKSLIVVGSGLMSALGSGALTINVLPREILVMECLVAGTSFRKLKTVEPDLKSEVKLECKREAKNEHDEYAVSLWYELSHVGYIPRDKNEVIARLMDAGKSFCLC